MRHKEQPRLWIEETGIGPLLWTKYGVAGKRGVESRTEVPISAVNQLRTRPDWSCDRFSRPIQDVARPSTPHAEFGIRAAQFEPPSWLQWLGRPRLTRPVESGHPGQAGRASRWTCRASVRSIAACRQ